MKNIKFNYLYRDGANYKNYGSIIFANPNNIDFLILDLLIRSRLIDGMWFYANKWQIPDLHFEKWDEEIDHTWHEFESVEYSDADITAPFSLNHFINIVKDTNNNKMSITPGDKSIDISDMFTVFTGKELDAAEIRKTAWERKKSNPS